MMRRTLLQLGAAGLLAACGPKVLTAAPAPMVRQIRRKIRAICFDLFTLFDPRSIVPIARSIVGEHAAELCEDWRNRQFQYGFIRGAAGQYADFRQITDDALVFAAKARGLPLSPAQRERLVRGYSDLEPWPDTRAQLMAFRTAGLKLTPLANFTPSMMMPLLDAAGLGGLFDAFISTDAARALKPDPRAYALGPSTLGLDRDEIAFAAFGGWDAAGARWFGYPTFWVNRLNVPVEELDPGPHASGPTLVELGAFVAGWAS